MKYCIIGDLEGRTIWKDIISKENPDITIFLGDYVASREVSPQQEVDTLKELLTYKEENPDKVILLRGNHCMEACGYYWAKCYPQACDESKKYLKDNIDRFLTNTQWIYQIPNTNIICSHAGIAKYFFKKCEGWLITIKGSQYDDNSIDPEIVLDLINSIPPCELFGFDGHAFDMYGDSSTQPCTWIRPTILIKEGIPGYIQVVGHTRIGEVSKYPKLKESDCDIWLCDALINQGYLIIEDGEFKPKKFQYEYKCNK